MNVHEHITHLSASAINDYTECGLLFKLGRIEKVPMEFTPDTLEFGSAVHKALAVFYEEKMTGNIFSSKELGDLFETHWKDAVANHPDIKYGKGKSFDLLRTHGRELLDAYYRSLPDDPYTVLAVEEYFEFYIEGLDVPLIGYIDLMEEDASGTIIITDWKTAAKAYTFDEVNKNFQLTLYTMAMKSTGFYNREILCKFDCLIKTKVPKFEQYYTTRNRDDEQRAITRINQTWEAITKGVFTPNDTSWKCKGCVYQNACKKYLEAS